MSTASELKKMLNLIKTQIALADSTLNTFETKHTKASATRCRKHLMAIKKYSDTLRREILVESKKPKNPVEPVEESDEVQVA